MKTSFCFDLSSAIRRMVAVSACLWLSIAAGADQAASGRAGTAATYPHISDAVSPVEVIALRGTAGNAIPAVVRKPPGRGPFPAVVFLHGGLLQRPEEYLRNQARNAPTHARFLAAGYVTVTPSFRDRRVNPQTRDALEDCLTVIAHVKKMPEVDPRSMVVVGGSGGGSLALELAGEADLCAIAAGEPASILFTGMLTASEDESRGLMQKTMDDPKAYYTPALQAFTRKKIAQIRCPVLIAHGDKHAINKINHEIIIPELKAAGKQLTVVAYPGQPHGFYFGEIGDPEAGEKFFHDANAFFTRHLAVQPKPLPESAVRATALPKKGKTDDTDPSVKQRPKNQAR